MAENNNFSTKLAKVTNIYAPMIERQLTGNGVNMSHYARTCVVNAISSINAALDAKGISWNDEQLDTNNLTQTLLHIAALQLNAAASPREVYFQIRNVKQGDNWRKQIEMGIEGDGNDAILRRFGADVEKVGQYWMVRREDDFVYPTYNGFEVTPPKWVPKGKGDVVRIVYPILKKDGTAEYHIAERDDVVRNLVAHVNNNLMNETFGICQDRYKATAEQKRQIAEKKSEILTKVQELGLTALDEPTLRQWISPAWTDPHSRESMIIRKMRNNILKKIPKDFGNAFVEMIHAQETDGEYAATRREIADNANRQIIDIDFQDGSVPETPTQPQAEAPEAATKQKSDPKPEPPQQHRATQTAFDFDEAPEPKKVASGGAPF